MTDLPTLEQVRDDLFARALAKHDGRVATAAIEIGVHYSTLYRWMTAKASCKDRECVQ